MLNTHSLFRDSVQKVNAMDKTLPVETQLKLYALYKQSTLGNCNTPKPSFWETKKLAKWNAWSGKRGMLPDHAKRLYTAVVHEISEK